MNPRSTEGAAEPLEHRLAKGDLNGGPSDFDQCADRCEKGLFTWDFASLGC
jgi:hypothetical protein